MENIGIDLGSYKTVIATSQNNGTIIYDNQSKRTIQTALELRTPTRFFGNNLPEPSRKFASLRKRNFNNVQDTESNQSLFSFIKYLQTLASPHAGHYTLAVPFYYGLKERADLYELCQEAGVNANFVTDICLLGMLYCVKFERSASCNSFLILDLGHSKTTAALFTKKKENEECVLQPIFVEGICKGGLSFDEKLINFIISKYKIKDDLYSREKLRIKINSIKCMLNNLNDYKFIIEIGDDSFCVCVTKTEYFELIEEDLKQFKDFFNMILLKVKEEKLDETFSVEVVGGNSFNCYMREIIDNILNENGMKSLFSMNAEESCGIGSAYAGAFYKFGSKMKVKMCDILVKDLFVRVYDCATEELFHGENNKDSENNNSSNNSNNSTNINDITNKVNDNVNENKVNENTNTNNTNTSNTNTSNTTTSNTTTSNTTTTNKKKVLVKKRNSLLPTNYTLLTYKKKENFVAEFLEGDLIVSRVFIYDIIGDIEINFGIQKNGILNYEIKNAKYIIEKRNYIDLSKNENLLRKVEEEAELVANMRNELESFLMNINYDFYKLNNEEIKIIEEIKEEMMYEKIPIKLEEENNKRKEIENKLNFIIDRIKEVGENKKRKLAEFVVSVDKIVEENKNNYVRSIYKLQGLLYNAKEIIKNINYSIFDGEKIFNLNVEGIIMDINIVKKNVEKEIEDKKKEEEKKVSKDVSKDVKDGVSKDVNEDGDKNDSKDDGVNDCVNDDSKNDGKNDSKNDSKDGVNDGKNDGKDVNDQVNDASSANENKANNDGKVNV